MTVTDAQVRAAVESWFAVTLKGTPPHIREAVLVGHTPRMRAALEAADSEKE